MADRDSRQGVAYHSPAIFEYMHRVHTHHGASLAKAFDAPGHHAMPAIQVGPAEGRLLRFLFQMAGVRKAVEVGTLAGFSAMEMALGMPDGGHLWSVEYDPKHAGVARENLAAAGLSARVTVLEGAGLDVLPTLVKHGPFDAVFIDADKPNYNAYGRWARDHLRSGGLLIGDNAYLFGRLLDDAPDARAMREFHEEAAAHFDTVCIPSPDGMLLGIKR